MTNHRVWVPEAVGWVPTGLRGVGLIAIVAMLINVVLDVLLRGLFNSPVQGTLELMTYWYMVAIALIGMWAAQTSDEHITVSILSEKSSPWARHWLQLFVGLITVGYVALIAFFGFTTAMENMATGEYAGASRLPIWPARFLIPLGLGAFAVTLTLQLVRAAKAGPTTESESDHLPLELEESDKL